MLSAAIIVFREILEAALVVTIVLAATRGVNRRNQWVAGRIAVGLLGAALVAAFTEKIAGAFEYTGQELFNAAVLLTAVVMLAWHNIWMSRHAQQLVSQLKRVGANVAAGQLPMYMLATAVGAAVLREGAEIVLFMYGLAMGGSQTAAMLAGGIAGLGCGVLTAALLYLGLLRIPTRNLFRVTGWLILLLASGMAASAAGYLAQAGWLPSQQPLWNSSALLSEHSLPGQLLHVLTGYRERPTAIQLGFYFSTLILIAAGMHQFRPPARSVQKPISQN